MRLRCMFVRNISQKVTLNLQVSLLCAHNEKAKFLKYFSKGVLKKRFWHRCFFKGFAKNFKETVKMEQKAFE